MSLEHGAVLPGMLEWTPSEQVQVMVSLSSSLMNVTLNGSSVSLLARRVISSFSMVYSCEVQWLVCPPKLYAKVDDW